MGTEEGGTENDFQKSNICKYCDEPCDPYENPGLECQECLKMIHVKCSKSVPTSFAGDVFFDLCCAECNPEGEETVVRSRMSWLKILVLVIYNLGVKSRGISRRGYYHWKSNISEYIDKHWEYLFQKSVKKKKNWIGTISGTLSHYNKIVFQSGTAELGEAGWWKLLESDPPEAIIAKSKSKDKKPSNESKLSITRPLSPSISESSLSIDEERKNQTKITRSRAVSPRSESSLSINDDSNYGTESSSRIQTPSMFSREYVQPSEVLSDCFLADLDIPDIDMSDMLEMDDSIDLTDQSNSFPFEDLMKEYQAKNFQANPQFQNLSGGFNADWINSIFNQEDNLEETKGDELEDQSEENSNHFDGSVQEPQNSLFNQTTRRDWPWKKSRNLGKIRPKMSKYEESYLFEKINKLQMNSAPPSLRRLYRKLCIRKLKRDNNLAIFDFDQFDGKKQEKNMKMSEGKNRVIDRFLNDNLNVVFEQRLQGYMEPIAVHSPYTNRLLKPFIRRDPSSRPLWLQVMKELRAKSNKNNPNWIPEEPSTIDYCYVSPQHIPAINSLCSQFFWPGVDLTECLQYPDFTCVVLYKKLVIGFAVLVPDVGYNEAYISFFLTRPEWRRCGIGSFMLYHLIQTCMGKDLTLHVSVTNPALILYQKFGFKVEEFIQDFYDKYMAPGIKESRHALFLRLSR